MTTLKTLFKMPQGMPPAVALVLETFAAIFGIAGALLLAINIHPAWGFAAFLVSNIGWMAFSINLRAWRMLAQQVCFLVTSLIGLWNWWLGPLLIGGAV